MNRILICGGSLLSLIVAAAVMPTSSADAAAAKSAKEIMGALFKGPKAAMATLKAATKGEPNWAKIQEASHTFVANASALPKAEAPLGDQASFEKLSKALAVNAEALHKAADAKDLDGVKASMQKIGSSCMACHKAHKPK